MSQADRSRRTQRPVVELDRRAFSGGAALAAALLGEGATHHAFAQDAPGVGPVVETAKGKVRGLTQGPVKVFRGLRYGASTAGPSRFMPPLPAEPWTGVKDATQFGFRSPQGPDAVIPEVAVSLGREPVNEDCLFLNVWTPAVGAGRRPVLVWFHGGGFARGSGSSSWFFGNHLAERRDVVVVTINHRLNVFGYLYLAELGGPAFAESGVVGMLDCVAALRWVRDNIAAFGGDPGRVTIFGQSGGGSKVSTLMGMPPAAGLFHRAVAMSGNALRATPPVAATRQARAFMDKLGLQPNQVDALRAAPMEQLIQASLGSPGAGAGPVAPSPSYPRASFGPDASPVSADVPMIMGSTTTEVTFFANTPLDPIDDATLRSDLSHYTGAGADDVESLITLYKSTRPMIENTLLYQIIASDWWLTADQATQAARKTALGRAPAYLYHFRKSTPVHDGKLHVPHTEDIPYMFDTLDAAHSIAGPGNQALADKMSAALAAFARTGDPNVRGLPHWPVYNADSRSVMAFDDTCTVDGDPHPIERATIQRLKDMQDRKSA